MNCAECRESLVACVEGLLGREESLQCQAHLETCAACRAEHTAITRLQRRLVARGQAAAEVSMVAPVMRRIRAVQPERESYSIMSKLFTRWGFGLGAAAGAAALILAVLLISPKTQATAAEVLARGARAVARLSSIHLRGQLRTLPADNFGLIDAKCDFCVVELWKQFAPELKWRVEKPGRVAVMDGHSTLLYIRPGNIANKLPQPTSGGAFDSAWLDRIANLSNTITNELKNALAKGWKMQLEEEQGADGRTKAVVTVEAKSGLPEGDYIKNKFFDNADTRRVYRFDTRTELLESVQIYLAAASGDVLIFELTQIDYNQPIDPIVFQLDLPENVGWVRDLQILPDNEKYAAMTVEEAARAFFEACAKEDWSEAQKFEKTPINERTKQHLGGLELVSLGESFTSKAYPGRFVPYEIKLRPQEVNVRLANTNSAKRYVITGNYDSKLQLRQELHWTNEPPVLADNDAYARMTPAEAAAAYFRAASQLNWAEMRKFVPDYDVANDKRQIDQAEKAGMDVRKLMPVTEVVEGFWSPEHSAWFVKCRVLLQIKKHNLALKKDPKTGRWYVDGGI
jgi:hypothetical protein